MPAPARDWAGAGGWDVAEVDAETCIMGQDYEGEGETTLGLMLSIDGSIILTAVNSKWSAVPKQLYDLEFDVKGSTYSGAKSIGVEANFKKGFATKFEPDFLKDFAGSPYLVINSKSGTLIDDLKLDGSAAGLGQLRRCVAHLAAVAAAEAREKARFAHIPEDPFATLKKDDPIAVTGPRTSVGRLAALITADDYPADAQRANEQGRVLFELKIGTDGRVTSCTVTQSSGSRSLDAATCRIMRSRARFTPAKAADGSPMPGSFTDEVTWRLY